MPASTEFGIVSETAQHTHTLMCSMSKIYSTVQCLNNLPMINSTTATKNHATFQLSSDTTGCPMKIDAARKTGPRHSKLDGSQSARLSCVERHAGSLTQVGQVSHQQLRSFKQDCRRSGMTFLRNLWQGLSRTFVSDCKHA